MRLARASGKPEREADVQATLGTAIAWTGRSRQGLAVLDRAVEASRGGMAGRTLMRRATILYELGRFREAHEDLSRALPFFRRAGDTVWEARSLMYPGPYLPRASVSLGVPRRTLPEPSSCLPPPGRSASTPWPGTTAGWWRWTAAIFPRRSPTSTKQRTATRLSA